MMDRKPDWDIELSRAVRKHAAMPFEWGTSDCLTFARDCVEAVTGQRLFDGVTYSTAKGAAAAMKRRGFDSIGSLVASVLPEQPPLCAGRGDVVVIEFDGVERGGVVTASGVAVKGPDGMTFLDPTFIRRAFKV